MGARLAYAKVVDREDFFRHGGRVTPGTVNKVIVDGDPGTAAVFLLLRGWTDDHGTFTEAWRIEAPGGLVVYEGVPRELHLPTTGHMERLEDEISDLKIDFAADDYEVVFTLDDREVARVTFPIDVAPGRSEETT